MLRARALVKGGALCYNRGMKHNRITATGDEEGDGRMEAIIRPARLDDAEALHRNCYPEHSLDDVREYLGWCVRQAGRGWIVRLVAEVDDQAVGNAQLTVWKQGGEIGSLVVAPGYRQRGLARRLVTALMEEADRRGLESLEIAASARQPAIVAFYEGLGFARVEGTVEPLGLAAGKKNGLFHPASLDLTVLLRKQRCGGR
jgi:GNAT superfamily N-acetyltransferase